MFFYLCCILSVLSNSVFQIPHFGYFSHAMHPWFTLIHFYILHLCIVLYEYANETFAVVWMDSTQFAVDKCWWVCRVSPVLYGKASNLFITEPVRWKFTLFFFMETEQSRLTPTCRPRLLVEVRLHFRHEWTAPGQQWLCWRHVSSGAPLCDWLPSPSPATCHFFRSRSLVPSCGLTGLSCSRPIVTPLHSCFFPFFSFLFSWPWAGCFAADILESS